MVERVGVSERRELLAGDHLPPPVQAAVYSCLQCRKWSLLSHIQPAEGGTLDYNPSGSNQSHFGARPVNIFHSVILEWLYQ